MAKHGRKSNYDDMDHLAKLATHKVGLAKPKMLQGSIEAGPVGKMGKFKRVSPEKQDHYVTITDSKGKNPSYVNDKIVGAPKKRVPAPAHVRMQLAQRRKNERIQANRLAFVKRVMGTEVAMIEIELVTNNICTPDIPLAECYSFAY